MFLKYCIYLYIPGAVILTWSSKLADCRDFMWQHKWGRCVQKVYANVVVLFLCGTVSRGKPHMSSVKILLWSRKISTLFVSVFVNDWSFLQNGLRCFHWAKNQNQISHNTWQKLPGICTDVENEYGSLPWSTQLYINGWKWFKEGRNSNNNYA